MATRFKTVTGNTAPDWEITCTRDGAAIDLTGASTEVIIKKRGGSITNAGHQDSDIITAEDGVISYTSEAGDFSTAGTYVGDVKVTYSGGGIETLYKQAIWQVRASN